MERRGRRLLVTLLNHASLVLFGCVFLLFGFLSPRFLDGTNLVNILVQSASLAILATGMTFVLLTAGVDLSVGAAMFLAAGIGGKLALAGVPFPLVLAAMLLVGLAFGALNAALVTRFGVIAFIATLATLFIGRGLGLWITETRAMNLPEAFLQLGAASLVGVPVPVVLVALVVVTAHLVLTRTPFGRQIYAIGADAEGARKAGIDVRRTLAGVYVICGLCAAVGGIVALSQLGAVSPTFGQQREFAAIAAAVLGGTSLFGGRGNVLPGTLIGAVLIQTIDNGLVILNADPYLYPIITSAIIFTAVLVDSARHRLLQRIGARTIRVAAVVAEPGAGARPAR